MKSTLQTKATSAVSRSAPFTATTVAPIRKAILLADDHPMMRVGVSQLINEQPDLQVVAGAGSPAEAITALSTLKIDLLVTDLSMPGRSGLDFIKDIHAMHPNLPILVVSMHDELIHAERALRAGAQGYIMKEAGGERLILAIRKVLDGQVYVSQKMSASLLDNVTGRKPRGSSSPIEKLTDREFQVFQLIGAGKGTKEIAEELHLSAKTVDVHRGNIKTKLILKDATALVRHAVRWVETGLSNSAGA